MKKVIVIEKPNEDDSTEIWTTLTGACDNHKEFQYHTIKKIDFPYFHKGYDFKKIQLNLKK